MIGIIDIHYQLYVPQHARQTDGIASRYATMNADNTYFLRVFLLFRRYRASRKRFHLFVPGPVSVRCYQHVDARTGLSRNTHLPNSSNHSSSATFMYCHFFVFLGFQNCRLRFHAQFVLCFAVLFPHLF